MSGNDQMVDQAQQNHVYIKVKNQDGDEVLYKVKRNAQFRKLMTAYCERKAVDPVAIVFLYDGRRIRAEQTPQELGMEDGDEIDAMMHQIGGGFGDIHL